MLKIHNQIFNSTEWSMSDMQTLSFKLGHVSRHEQLHACLRFKLVHVAENVQQRPLGWHFLVSYLPIKSYSQCLMTLIYLWAFPIMGFWVKCCLELTFNIKIEESSDALIPARLAWHNLASRNDCSSLGPRMLTLNFPTLNFAAEFCIVEFGDVENMNIWFWIDLLS